MEAGREQFGDLHTLKLRQFTHTLRDNLTGVFALTITLLSPSWFWFSIVSSVLYFLAENHLQLLINRSEIGDDLDSTIISFTMVKTFFNCFIYCAISYAKFHSQAHLFLKNQQGVRQTEQMHDVLTEIEDGVIILAEEDNEENTFNAVEFANSFM